MSKYLLEIKDLTIRFTNSNSIDYAVNNISFFVKENEVLGIVGESGCGKTVTCKAILGINNNAAESGEILFKDRNILNLSEKEYNTIRGKEISMIFQNPVSALNPMVTIGKQIVEIIKLHQKVDTEGSKTLALNLFNDLDIPDASKKMDEYPHQQSAGINQRIVIAIALSCKPKLLIADEPTASLDITIQNQILEIFKTLKNKLSIIFVSHDLAVIREITDHIIVMYNGMIMEEGQTDNIFKTPLHPYTKALLASIPFLNKEKIILKGEPPSTLKIPVGCPFVNRCPCVIGNICHEQKPKINKLENNVSCHLYNK